MNVEAQRISPAPIRQRCGSKASRQKAFDTFVGAMGGWWLKTPQPARLAAEGRGDRAARRRPLVRDRRGRQREELGPGARLGGARPRRARLAAQRRMDLRSRFRDHGRGPLHRRRRPHDRRVRASRPRALRRQCRGGARRLRHRHGRRLGRIAGGYQRWRRRISPQPGERERARGQYAGPRCLA